MALVHRRFDAEKMISVFGDKQLAKELKELANSVQRSILRKALKPGLTIIAREVRRRVPKRTGLMKKSIKTKVGKRKAWGMIYVDPHIVGETKDGNTYRPAKIAHYVEFGTRYAKAKPFLRPAVLSKQHEALAVIEKKTKEHLERAWQQGKVKFK